MKVQLKHFFSLLFLFATLAVAGQDPDIPPVKTDTIKTAVDSIGMPMNNSNIRDTLKFPVDSIQALNDTVTLKVDTVLTPTDSVQISPDSLNLHPGEVPVLKPDTSRKDSVKVLPTKPEKQKVTPKVVQQVEEQPKDTVKAPIGFEVLIDYSKLITIPSEFEMKLEGGFDIIIQEKILIQAEIGYGKLTPAEAIKNGSYTSEGIYGRGGLAYGGEILPKTFLYLGIMYGISQFEDNATVLIESQAWDDLDESFIRKDLKATWFEIALISETEIKKNLFLGSKWRVRKLNTFQNDYDPVIYSIPGYGRTFDNSIPAINLYIKYRFSL